MAELPELFRITVITNLILDYLMPSHMPCRSQKADQSEWLSVVGFVCILSS